ncbi:uncharacterized protein LOC128683251 [Plodia interpunctella]|uniref:uncharacterized protein LOC128683251 n=1 Tax=Plodia interpunctella TaxID=58824 RepID=UPI002368D728|nr:uncharacterized protein LOC128683251 [Plodia interpunctella]
MAYNLSERFPPAPKNYTIFDPGAYQHDLGYKFKHNKAPFLSKTPRITGTGNKLWTQSIYNTYIPTRIPNMTSLMSKCPRFPYEAFSKEDLERLLCRCGIQNECECTEEEEHEDILCQGHVPRCLYKGPPPRSMLLGDSGLSAPSKRDHGFEISKDGSQKRNLDKVSDESPPFYDARVIESTEYYQGCKWSAWTSKRFKKSFSRTPGPADYTIDQPPTLETTCYEINRHRKRKTSKQPRFIEIIQNLNIKEGRPGPATYSPKVPKSINTQYYGSKAERFNTSKYNIGPGPTDYVLKRMFDLPEIPEIPCHAKLPEPSCFGVKAQRFKPRVEEGASPASYNVNYKPCQYLHCLTAPFGSNTMRFKQNVKSNDEDNEQDEIASDDPEKFDDDESSKEKCPTPTWEFKSKVIRLKPLRKKLDEPSPADLPQSSIKVERLPYLQYTAPFFSSEGRFEPWNDWMPVLGKLKTPGPAYYCLEKPRCNPAVNRGPLVRAPRFPRSQWSTPAPNEYVVGGGIETVLNTCNKRLTDNIENQHKFHWEPPKDPKSLSYEEREMELLQKSIMLLEVDGPNDKTDITPAPEQEKQKFLRCFL